MLAGFGLGQTFMSIVFMSTGIKFIQDGACSLISHAYGQKDYRLCQVYRNQAIFFATIIFCILLIPSAFAWQIFDYMGLDEKVVEYGTTYVWIITGVTYLSYVLEVNLVYAQCQQVTWYNFASSITGFYGLVFFALLFQKFSMGYNGIVYANAIYFFINAVMANTLLMVNNEVRQFDDCYLFSRETVSGLLPMLQKGLGGMSLGIL